MSGAGQDKAARVGRPVVLAEPARRALVMDAAERVFLAKGYVAATMHAIADEARMSKKTIYQVFPSKLALFDALLSDRLFNVPVAPDPPDGDQEDALVHLVTAIAGVLLRPDRMGLIRLVIVDGQASPELATAFDRLKMASDLNAMEVWLGREQARNRLRQGNVAEDARLLFGMTIAEPILQALVRAHGSHPHSLSGRLWP